MHPTPFPPHRQRGGVLLTVVIMSVVLAVVAGSVLSLVLAANKNSVRNELLMRARMVAESELEAIFYQFILKTRVDGVEASQVPTNLTSILDDAEIPSTVRDCFLDSHRTEGWKVKRSMFFEDASFGQIPRTRKAGWVAYLTARVEILPPAGSSLSVPPLKIGRRMSLSTASIFQMGIFYENDLEFNPGNDVQVDGDIASNQNIYMGSTASGKLTIGAMVRYPKGKKCNEDADGNVIYRKPDTPVASGSADIAPIWATGDKALQIEEMNEPENLVGGLDVNVLLKTRSDLFKTQNDVYRALIVPPPNDTFEYPDHNGTGDDPTIAALRLYNRAGLRMNVETDGSIKFYRGTTDVTADFPGVASSSVNMYDQREAKNIKVAVLDMKVLKEKLDAMASDPTKPFNGIFYVNQKSGSTSNPTGLIIKNARATPQTTSASGGEAGFSLATNGGLYIQGSFNTTPLANGKVNPSLLMSDAVTLLSENWKIENGDDVLNGEASVAGSGRVAGHDSDPGWTHPTAAADAELQVNAGILTGNTPASDSQASGGAQNLIRYLERWQMKDDPDGLIADFAYQTRIKGSLGCLFESKFFNSPWKQPGSIYVQPSLRYFEYDKEMRESPPSGTPFSYRWDRGAFFFW